MGSIRKTPNGRWVLTYRTAQGRGAPRRSRTFDTKAEAKAYDSQMTVALARGEWLDPRQGQVTFGEFADRWLAAQTFDPSTREVVKSRLNRHLKPTFADTALVSIRPSDVQAWLRARQMVLAPGTVRGLLANLSSILSAGVADGCIARNPCGSTAVKAPRQPQNKIVPWPTSRVLAVANALPDRYQAVVYLAAGCGLRQGECFGLRVQDVEFLTNQVNIRQQVKRLTGQQRIIAPPKGGRQREVPLPESVKLVLSEHLRRFPSDGLVFTDEQGRSVERSTFNKQVWRPALTKAKVPWGRENGMHALRHYYASVQLDAGTSIRALAEYLGHADPGFTLRVYTHLMPASEDRARQAVDAAFDDGDNQGTTAEGPLGL